MTKMLKLSDETFQIAVINLLEANGETESLSKEIETLSKGVEYVKKNQMEASELKKKIKLKVL